MEIEYYALLPLFTPWEAPYFLSELTDNDQFSEEALWTLEESSAAEALG